MSGNGRLEKMGGARLSAPPMLIPPGGERGKIDPGRIAPGFLYHASEQNKSDCSVFGWKFNVPGNNCHKSCQCPGKTVQSPVRAGDHACWCKWGASRWRLGRKL